MRNGSGTLISMLATNIILHAQYRLQVLDHTHMQSCNGVQDQENASMFPDTFPFLGWGSGNKIIID